MNTDRIARAMTAGRPRADFTARVMAPIYGRPRPGFTQRVINGLEAPAARRTFGPGFKYALALVPAAVVLVAGLMVIRASHVELPPAPVAPKLARASLQPRSPSPLHTVATVPPRVASRSPDHARVEEPATAELPPIYMIPALDGPGEIAVKSIEPAGFTIPALDGPAPLKIADLKHSKEKP